MFETSFIAEWGDCDPAGIVFYPGYFRWMDTSFQQLLRSRSLSQAIITDRFGAVTPLLDARAAFRGPVRPGDTMLVSVEVKEWAERRFRLLYRFAVADRPVVEGEELRGWATMEGGTLRGAPIPPEFRALMS